MGYTRRRRLLRVELPLAMPAIIAGVRIATVSTVGLVTVTALIGQGGLGQLLARRLPTRLPDAAHRRHRAVARARGRRRPAVAGRAHARDAVATEGTPVMGFLGDVASFLTDGANWHGDGGHPDALLAAPAAHAGLGRLRRAHRVADRRDRRPRAARRRDRDQRRQRRSRAPGARVAHPRGALGRRGQARGSAARSCSRFPRSSRWSRSRCRRWSRTRTSASSSVEDDVRQSARGMGMSGRQVLTRVELPLAMPLIWAGHPHGDGRGGRDRDARGLRGLRWPRSLHRRRVRGAGPGEGLRRRPPRGAAGGRARAGPRRRPAPGRVARAWQFPTRGV